MVKPRSIRNLFRKKRNKAKKAQKEFAKEENKKLTKTRFEESDFLEWKPTITNGERVRRN